MKWFRHMADASNDEFIAELESLFGWEGYGRWWKLLEIIAAQMDKTDKCSASYSWSDWQRFLKGKRNKLETFLVHLQNKRKINLKQNGNVLEIFCPKLLELRDEYSRKSGQTPDMCPDKVAPDTEVDTITNVIGQKPPDLRKEIFDLGIRSLTTTGRGEQQIRKLVGKWVSTHPDEHVLQAIIQSQKQSAIEPISYIEQILKPPKKHNRGVV